MYKCPRCTSDLRTSIYEGVEIETCPTCEGEWLDADELRAIIDRVEQRFTAEEIARLDQASREFFATTRQTPERMPCPKCFNVKLTPFNYASTSGVILDKCPQCGGIWLDRGELEMVQALVSEWNGRLRREPVRFASATLKIEEETQKEVRTQAGDSLVGSRFSFVLAILRAFR